MKSAVWFFLGLVLGTASGAYVAKSIAEKKAEDQIEKATVEARNYYKEKYEPKKEEPVKEPEKVTRIYGKAFDLYSRSPEEVKIEDGTREEDPSAETYAYPIDADDFGMDSEYTTYTLDYYTDGNLVDETGNIVDDPVHIVGGDILDELSATNPVLYVRNDITKTDYEVCFVDAPFSLRPGV